MRVMVSEYFCSGGLCGGPLEADLLREGAAMLRTLVEDFVAAGHDVVVPLDERLPRDLPGTVIAVDAGSPLRAAACWEREAAAADAALVVAPESDGLLATAIDGLERLAVANLGSSASAVRACSDKHALGRRLAASGLPTPAGFLGLGQAASLLERAGEIIVKPNRGAGCTDTFVCRSMADVGRLPIRSDWLVQPRCRGLAASAAIVVPPHGAATPLRAGMQRVAATDAADAPCRLVYSGGELPLPAALESRALALATAAVSRLPGLRGLVGIDLVLGDAPAEDVIIEVNPRPTVAYVGLRRLARFSIPQLIVGDRPTVAWGPGVVRYAADGGCEWS